jgi:hypothetical protein
MYECELENLVRNGDDSVSNLNIHAIVPRRASDGSNNRMMDGHYAFRQFVQISNEDEANDSAFLEKWGRAIASRITELNKTSAYPTVCVYGGNITPVSGPPSVDTHLMNKDVVTIATNLYNNAIADGSFFEEYGEDGAPEYEGEEGFPESFPSVSSEFFGSIEDPRSLFVA